MGRKEYTEVGKGWEEKRSERKGGEGRKGREPRRVGGSIYPTRWRNGQVVM